MKRRYFLLSTVTLAFSQLLVNCAGKNQATPTVRLPKNSIPSQGMNQFRKRLNNFPNKNIHYPADAGVIDVMKDYAG